MSDTALFLLVSSVAAVAALSVVALVMRGHKKRQLMIAEAAGRIGARFEATPDHRFVHELKDTFWIFRYVRRNTVTNLVHHSAAGATFRLFDYAYWRVASRTPTLMTVLLVSSPGLQLPAFTIGDTGGPLRIRDSVVSDPVQFPVAAFCAAHQVHADDEAAVQSCFSESLQTYLARRPDLCMEGAGDNLLIYEPAGRINPEDVRQRLEEGEAILKGLT